MSFRFVSVRFVAFCFGFCFVLFRFFFLVFFRLVSLRFGLLRCVSMRFVSSRSFIVYFHCNFRSIDVLPPAWQIHPGIVRLMQGREPFDTSMDGMDMEVMKGFTWESIIARYNIAFDIKHSAIFTRII